MTDRQAAVEALLERFERPSHRGAPEGPASTGHAENPVCGDVVDAYVRVAEGLVGEARFDGRGCTISIALADAACQAIEGLSIEDARRVHLRAVLEIVGAGIADSRPACATVGLRAVHAALEQAIESQ